MDENKKNLAKCNFCNRHQGLVNKLIAGPHGVYICDNCVRVAHSIIYTEKQKKKEEGEEKHEKFLTPTELKQSLDQYIISQNDAKKKIAVAVYNHYKRINSRLQNDDVEILKSNILLIGPTGTGKTLMAQSLAKILSVPFAITDATTLTEAGYVGEDVENIILKLFQSANGDIEKTKKGIVYIDEIDKIGRKTDSPSITRDVSGEGVQQALLKIIEGTIANVPPQGGRKHPQQKYIPIDTNDILFIMGGTFNGLDDIIQERMGKSSVGFKYGAQDRSPEKKKEMMDHVIPQDLIKFGLIPELVGRIPIVSVLSELTNQDLVNILTKPKNAIIKQYQRLFEMEDVKLKFTKGALEAVAHKSTEREMGARGLRSIIEELMLDIMFHLPSQEKPDQIKVTKKMIENNVLEYDKLKKAVGV
ncbi:MAG: ATP-dependent Clp protease ATP-binding subunit ClpX [Candidatus Aminicenantes bacterium]|nr:ATP-dependent Clp protease ATP-binding subunit ClpX [Candidatus Aminicenantes bacterium]